MENPSRNVVVISNEEDIYVWRPEREHDVVRVNQTVEKLKSFLRPVSESMGIFNIGIDGFIPQEKDSLWVNPEGAGLQLERGEIARLRKKIPVRVKTEGAEIKTLMKFKFRLTRPGTANALVCGGDENERRSLEKEDATLDCEKDFIQEKTEAGGNPLLN
jgi:hypothetical protein